ncbi:MAG TPA: hypothetical protein P5556_04270 [Candidatus Gastranaerophilales bacterium]|nr:hypothetical protein [Candidatus Gastranaerophilales bacterium]
MKMKSTYNSKIIELKQVLSDIKEQELALEELKAKKIKEQDDSSIKEKTNTEKNILKLKDKKNKLNEELIENEEIFENTKMKYAILILLNFGNDEQEYCLQ